MLNLLNINPSAFKSLMHNESAYSEPEPTRTQDKQGRT